MFIFCVILVAALIWLIYKAYKNTRQVMVNHVEISGTTPHKQSRFFNVLHISDMHLENISITPDRLYENLQDQKIDMIALTGDFLDRKRSIPKLVPYLEALNRLDAQFGIYAVFGNHDYVLKEKDFAELRRVLNGHGCKTLQNENDCILVDGTQVNLIGIDDYSTKRSDLSASYAGIEPGYNLVLTHDPNLVLEMERHEFDYLLSGHFHGGQIYWPKPYHLAKMGKLVRMNMIKGLHYCHGKPFYINEGLGQTLFNIRIGSRPEITLHQLLLPQQPVENHHTAVAV